MAISDYVYGPGNLLLEQITPQPAISLVGTATASGKSSSLTLTLPTGVQVNDQVFAATTEPSTTTVTTPSGYTAVASVSSRAALRRQRRSCIATRWRAATLR